MKNLVYKTVITLTWTATLFCCSIIKAQDYVRTTEPNGSFTSTSENKKFCIKLSAGMAVPLGDFGSTNVNGSFWDFNSIDSTRLQGFATTGFHFDCSLTYYVYDYFGIALSIGYNINGINLNAFSNAVGLPATASTTTYSTGEYLIGPVFNFSMTPKIKLTAGVYVGFARNNYPEFTVALNDTITDTRTIQNGSLSFAYCISGGFAFSITNNTDITLDVAYTGTVLHYLSWIDTYQITSTNPAYYYLPFVINHPNNSTFMNTGILKPCIGVAFKF